MSNRWYLGVGEQSDIVVSTRIRLARNLKEYPFPNKLNTKNRIIINNIINISFLFIIHPLHFTFIPLYLKHGESIVIFSLDYTYI